MAKGDDIFSAVNLTNRRMTTHAKVFSNFESEVSGALY